MVVGITYDLKDDYLGMGFSEEETAEFDSRETIDGIENALKSLEFQTERIGNLHQLVKALGQGRRWDWVFNISEGMYGFGRESTVPALLDAYQIPYSFSGPLVLSMALHKGIAKTVVSRAGVLTPSFIVVDRKEQLQNVNLPFPLFLKPVAEGTGKGITRDSRVTNMDSLISVGESLLEAFKQPVLVETFLPGREFTVGIIGSGENAEIVGVMEIVFGAKADSNIYSFYNKKNYQEAVSYVKTEGLLRDSCREVALQAWRALGCRDAGRIDVRADAEGRIHFLEVNPLAGLNPQDSDLPIICAMEGISYQELIQRIVFSMSERLRQNGVELFPFQFIFDQFGNRAEIDLPTAHFG